VIQSFCVVSSGSCDAGGPCPDLSVVSCPLASHVTLTGVSLKACCTHRRNYMNVLCGNPQRLTSLAVLQQLGFPAHNILQQTVARYEVRRCTSLT
jgi:hypothetical protein